MSVTDKVFLRARFPNSSRIIVLLGKIIVSISLSRYRKVYISSGSFQQLMAYQDKLWNPYKSDGEKKIGDYLQNREISFSYERPVAVVDSGKTKLWYPDFFLDDYHILIEYLGMNGNQQSAKMNDYKRGVYRANRFYVIEIYPTDFRFRETWQDKIDSGIRNTLEGRVRDYTSKARTYHQTKPYRQTSFKFRY